MDLKKTLQKEDYKMNYQHYDLIADLFDYPDAKYPDRVKNVTGYLKDNYPKASEPLDAFLKLLPEENVDEMQELFTRSFDVQSVTTLDVGYVLFGDDYKRGELLSNLMKEHNKVKNNCGTELADHLPNILRLLARLKDKELAVEMVKEIIFPAVKKMIGEFSPDRLETKKESYKKHYKTLIEVSENKETLYVYTLMALDTVFCADFILTEKKQNKPTSDFIKSVVGEMKIENQFNDRG